MAVHPAARESQEHSQHAVAATATAATATVSGGGGDDIRGHASGGGGAMSGGGGGGIISGGGTSGTSAGNGVGDGVGHGVGSTGGGDGSGSNVGDGGDIVGGDDSAGGGSSGGDGDGGSGNGVNAVIGRAGGKLELESLNAQVLLAKAKLRAGRSHSGGVQAVTVPTAVLPNPAVAANQTEWPVWWFAPFFDRSSFGKEAATMLLGGLRCAAGSHTGCTVSAYTWVHYRGCGVWRVGCGVWGVGCGVWGVGCGVWCVGCGMWCVGCGVWGVACVLWRVEREGAACVCWMWGGRPPFHSSNSWRQCCARNYNFLILKA
eukprot:358493-Chlamydomonas_euryale.AAC.3